jgi:DNA modification methylase
VPNGDSGLLDKNRRRLPKPPVVLPGSLNNLNGSEWTLRGKSVQKFDGPIAAKRRLHGAAFPTALAKHFIGIYSKPGDLVFDPFCGVGTTLEAANLLERHAVGMELNKEFARLGGVMDPKDGRRNPDYKIEVHNDDTLNVKKHIKAGVVDMILTSPPYACLLNNIRENFADKDYRGNPYKNQSRRLARPYSASESDLGNVSYADYLEKINRLFLLHHEIAKPGCYNLWVVRDYRDLKNAVPYVNLHGDLINIAGQTGWVMWDLVVWDQSNQRKLVRLGGNKSRRYYFNIGHSFVLVFRKNMSDEVFR